MVTNIRRLMQLGLIATAVGLIVLATMSPAIAAVALTGAAGAGMLGAAISPTSRPSRKNAKSALPSWKNLRRLGLLAGLGVGAFYLPALTSYLAQFPVVGTALGWGATALQLAVANPLVLASAATLGATAHFARRAFKAPSIRSKIIPGFLALVSGAATAGLGTMLVATAPAWLPIALVAAAGAVTVGAAGYALTTLGNRSAKNGRAHAGTPAGWAGTGPARAARPAPAARPAADLTADPAAAEPAADPARLEDEADPANGGQNTIDIRATRQQTLPEGWLTQSLQEWQQYLSDDHPAPLTSDHTATTGRTFISSIAPEGDHIKITTGDGRAILDYGNKMTATAIDGGTADSYANDARIMAAKILCSDAYEHGCAISSDTPPEFRQALKAAITELARTQVSNAEVTEDTDASGRPVFRRPSGWVTPRQQRTVTAGRPGNRRVYVDAAPAPGLGGGAAAA